MEDQREFVPQVRIMVLLKLPHGYILLGWQLIVPLLRNEQSTKFAVLLLGC